MVKLSSEDQFIEDFIKVYFGNGDPQELTKVLSCCSGQQLSRRAAEKGVAAFFYTAITSGKVEAELPIEVLNTWKSSAHTVGLHNALLETEGQQITRDLEGLGADYILLKGFSLLESLYGNTWTRPLSDLDILIHPGDYQLIKETLYSRGYSIVKTADYRGTLEEFIQVNEKLSTEITFSKSRGGININIDLHWAIGGLLWENSPFDRIFPIEQYPWWDHVSAGSSREWDFRCLSREMQFLHIVFHFALHHQFQGIKWFLDICLFICNLGNDMDWDLIHQIAGDPDCRKLLGITLRMAEEFTGCREDKAPHWQTFWSGVGMPGEYRFFRQRLLSDSKKSGQYMAFTLLPLNFNDKASVLSYLLFNRAAVHHWHRQEEKKGWSLLQPFYILYRTGEEFLKHRK